MVLLREIFSSKKFLALIGALVAWMAASAGFSVDQASIDKFLGLVAVYMLAQGVADHGKAAAQIVADTGTSTRTEVSAGGGQVLSTTTSSSPSSPVAPSSSNDPAPAPAPALATVPRGEGGYATPAVMLAIAIASSTLVTGCGAVTKMGSAIVDGIVDCTTAEAKKLIGDAGKLTDIALINSTDLEAGMIDLAKDSAVDILGCLLADATTRALKPRSSDPTAPRSSPLEFDPKVVRAAWEKAKASRFPGVRTFRTANGDI